MARVCAVIANCAPRGKDKHKTFSEDDFMPRFRKAPKKRQTADEMLEIAKIFTAANGGEIVMQ